MQLSFSLDGGKVSEIVLGFIFEVTSLKLSDSKTLFFKSAALSLSLLKLVLAALSFSLFSSWDSKLSVASCPPETTSFSFPTDSLILRDRMHRIRNSGRTDLVRIVYMRCIGSLAGLDVACVHSRTACHL